VVSRRTAVDHHDPRVGDELVDRVAHLVRLVAHDPVARDDRARGGDVLLEPVAVGVVVRRARVADRDDPDRDRPEVGSGRPVRVGAHDERS
jgi:hypothetical protein